MNNSPKSTRFSRWIASFVIVFVFAVPMLAPPVPVRGAILLLIVIVYDFVSCDINIIWGCGGGGAAPAPVPPPAPTGTITPSNCVITTGTTCTTSIAWTTSNAVSPSMRQGGVVFSTAASSEGVSRTVTYGSNLFTLFSDNTLLDSKLSYATAYDQGVLGPSNGRTFATAPTTGLCTSGTISPVVTTSSGWLWTCGSGVGLVTGTATRVAVCGDNICTIPEESFLTCPTDCNVNFQQF